MNDYKKIGVLFTCMMLFVCSITAFADAQNKTDDVPLVTLDRAGYMQHKQLNEVSGIVRERCKEANWWVLNDSGNDAVVYRIDKEGKIVNRTYDLGEMVLTNGSIDTQKGYKLNDAKNVDWEDIAIHDDKLYVVDMGNNGNARKDLGVYVVSGLWNKDEQNKYHWNGKINNVKRYQVKYPEQESFPAKEFEFDCESAFFLNGKFHILTKHRTGQTKYAKRGTKLYRIDRFEEDQVNELKLIDRNDDIGVWVTGADVSPDGNRLAILGQYELYIYDRPANGSDKWLTHGNVTHVRLPSELVKQAESICWDDDKTLRIANEQRDIYTLPIKRIEEATGKKYEPNQEIYYK
ncbi:hypothetical protein JD969_13955 [Planctomycetota bacterium]|nr:hypothetical protein JD969_13955 [Planctomycetota bacterium]